MCREYTSLTSKRYIQSGIRRKLFPNDKRPKDQKTKSRRLQIGPMTSDDSRARQPLTSVAKVLKDEFSNIDFFLKILPLKDDELAMSEM